MLEIPVHTFNIFALLEHQLQESKGHICLESPAPGVMPTRLWVLHKQLLMVQSTDQHCHSDPDRHVPANLPTRSLIR